MLLEREANHLRQSNEMCGALSPAPCSYSLCGPGARVTQPPLCSQDWLAYSPVAATN